MPRLLDRSCYVPKRFIVALLGFFGMFNSFSLRVNLSVAIVAMTSKYHSVAQNGTSGLTGCTTLQDQEGKVTYTGEQYRWKAETQGMVLAAFFFGNMITQLPGGYVSKKFGFKWVFGGGIFIASILTLLTPISASLGKSVLIATRFIEGLALGVTFPASNYIVSKWSPRLERSRVSSVVFMGAQMGNVVSMPLSGWLCSSHVFGGWPSAFYVTGIFGCVWFVLWAIFVYESPYVHPTISDEELAYFQEDDKGFRKKPLFPWKDVFTSVPLWATLIAQFGHNFGLVLYLAEIPTYLNSIFHITITKIGVYSALPFIMQIIVAWIVSLLADKIRSSGRLSITSIRKIMNSIGLFVPAICLLGVTESGCRPELVIGLLILGLAVNGSAYSGYNVTHVDMCPDFAGTLYAMGNISIGLWGVVIPNIVEVMNVASISGWNNVFYITSTFYIVGAIVYLIFASAEEQPWGRVVKMDNKNEYEMKEIPDNACSR